MDPKGDLLSQGMVSYAILPAGIPDAREAEIPCLTEQRKIHTITNQRIHTIWVQRYGIFVRICGQELPSLTCSYITSLIISTLLQIRILYLCFALFEVDISKFIPEIDANRAEWYAE